MHEEYNRIYRELSHLSEQRIMDEKRTIYSSTTGLEILKAELVAGLNVINTENRNRFLTSSPSANDIPTLALNRKPPQHNVITRVFPSAQETFQRSEETFQRSETMNN